MPKKRIPSDRLVKLVSPMRVKYRDVFDLKQFYIFLHEWLMEHEWEDSEGDGDHWETYYYERVGAGNIREIYIHWRVRKKAEHGQFMYYLDFNWHCVGLTKVEVLKEGQKMSVDKGEIELYVTPYIEELYKTYFKGFLKQFEHLFSARAYEETREARKKELYQETYALQNAIKQWFKLARHLPYDESKLFFRSKAWPSHSKE